MEVFNIGDIVKTQIGSETLYGRITRMNYDYANHNWLVDIKPFGSSSSSINNHHIINYTILGLEKIEHFSADDALRDDTYPGYSRYNVPLTDYRSRYLGEMFKEGPNKNMKISFNQLLPRIIDVIYHEPATIVKWSDGSKTVVKCGENDIYDPEKGLAMCIAKKTLGNNGNYYELFKKWLPKEPEVESISMDNKDITFNLDLDPNSIVDPKENLLTEEQCKNILEPNDLLKDLMTDIGERLETLPYGIAYTDGTEKITQLRKDLDIYKNKE